MRSLRILPVFLLLGIIITLSCKQKTDSLPPTATNRFALIQNWDYGKAAYTHTENILNFGPRPIESGAHKKVQAYITKELEKSGWVVTKQSFKSETPYGSRNFTNLVARYNSAKKGAKPTISSPKILIAAHYDSKMMEGFLGADDAATCVGAILEIAQHLPQQTKSIASEVELVFFDGEEALKPNIVKGVDGLYGSYYYSKYLQRDVSGPKNNYSHLPKFGLVLDMIGHKDLSISIPSDTPYKLLKRYIELSQKNNVQDTFKVFGYKIIDDHVPMNEIAKVPTIDFIGDFSSSNWWHTNKDNLDIVSEESLSKSIRFVLEFMLEVYESGS